MSIFIENVQKGVKKMSLLDALLATIAEEWEHQLDDVYLSNPNQKIDLLYGVKQCYCIIR